MRKIIIGIVITVFWLAMMTVLVLRHTTLFTRREAPPLNTETLSESWRDSDEWMELLWNNFSIGFLRTTTRRLYEPVKITSPSGEAPLIDRNGAFHATIQGVVRFGPFGARINASALLTQRLMLDRFRMVAELGPGATGRSVVSAESTGNAPDASDAPAAKADAGRKAVPAGPDVLQVDGLARGGRLYLRIQRGDAIRFENVAMPRPAALADSLRPLYSRADLKPGDVYSIPVFDPVWNMQGGVMTVRVQKREAIPVEGRNVDALRIETEMGAVRTTTWTDDQGRVLRREMPPFTMVAAAPKRVIESYPWMAILPDTPKLRFEDFQGQNVGEPLGEAGLIGILRQSLAQTPLAGMDKAIGGGSSNNGGTGAPPPSSDGENHQDHSTQNPKEQKP